MTATAFQDLLPVNHCWGCAPDAKDGLRIRSVWDGDETVCEWTPRPEFAAGPRHILYGGMIGCVIDCHSIWTAIATAYRAEGREIGDGQVIWFATAALSLSYRKPTPVDQPLTLRARVTEMQGRKALVSCSLTSGGAETATGEMVAVRVPPEWFEEEQEGGRDG